MDTFNLEDFLPYRLAVLSSRVSSEFAKLYGAEFGISLPEWRLIAHLAQQEEVSIREIYTRVGMDKSKVSRAAARLEAAGIVSKKVNNADKRLIELSLTEKGRTMMAEIAPMSRAFEEDMLTALPPAQRAALNDALDTLLNAFPPE